ncbi:MAG: hypothetical protein KQH83_12710 [Actinobacteria bacterium]|nr:hypothetical protein [Actinomycetota bacterium]
MRKAITLLVALAIVAAACGDDDESATTAATTTTEAATTTAAPTTTTEAPTTTTTEAPSVGAFTMDDLPALVTVAGDPWVIPVADPAAQALTIDDVWPAEAFPEERQAYVDGEFLGGHFSAFVGDPNGLLLTGAHLFEGSGGADAALDLLTGSFTDTALVAAITGVEPGSLDTVEELEAPALGDRAVAVRVSGDQAQVVGILWITGNLLQFVRSAMAAGDTEREAASFAVAEAMAARSAG